jgi:hypothetical protein
MMDDLSTLRAYQMLDARYLILDGISLLAVYPVSSDQHPVSVTKIESMFINVKVIFINAARLLIIKNIKVQFSIFDVFKYPG